MKEEKNKVGRPIKLIKEVKAKRTLMLRQVISNALDDLAMKFGKTISEVVEDLVSAAALQSDEEMELDRLRAEKAKHDYEAAKLATSIREKEESIRRTQEIQDQILRTNMFIVTSFRMLYEKLEATGQFTADLEKIEPIWGITFNAKKCNEHFHELKTMDDDKLVRLLELKKVAKNPKMLPEIMKRVGF